MGLACTACIILSTFFFFVFKIFTKCFKTYHFGKSIALSGKHGFAFSSRTCRQKLHFCVSTVNECVFIILLLASVRLHILHCSGSSRASFERLSFQKLVQIIQQNLSFCQSRSEKPLLLKSRILKIRQGFSIFEDRKRLFGSVFAFKLTSPRSRPVVYPRQMLCFVPLGGPSWILCLFDTFFDFFSLFLLFSLFVSSAKKCPSPA